jgi:FkbM family methyltransferase
MRRNIMLNTNWMLRVISGEEILYRSEVSCTKVRLGSDYGGWTVCPEGLSSQSLVYSVGLGSDITFDRALIDRYGLQVVGFDPTPFSLSYLQSQELPPHFHHLPYALAANDGELSFYPPPEANHVSFSLLQRTMPEEKAIVVTARRLQSIMQELGHDHIDVLKLDVEGAEYDILQDMLSSGIRPRQCLIEFHHRYREVGFHKTQSAVDALRQAGYRIFHVGRGGLDYSFIYNGAE